MDGSAHTIGDGEKMPTGCLGGGSRAELACRCPSAGSFSYQLTIAYGCLGSGCVARRSAIDGSTPIVGAWSGPLDGTPLRNRVTIGNGSLVHRGIDGLAD